MTEDYNTVVTATFEPHPNLFRAFEDANAAVEAIRHAQGGHDTPGFDAAERARDNLDRMAADAAERASALAMDSLETARQFTDQANRDAQDHMRTPRNEPPGPLADPKDGDGKSDEPDGGTTSDTGDKKPDGPHEAVMARPGWKKDVLYKSTDGFGHFKEAENQNALQEREPGTYAVWDGHKTSMETVGGAKGVVTPPDGTRDLPDGGTVTYETQRDGTTTTVTESVKHPNESTTTTQSQFVTNDAGGVDKWVSTIHIEPDGSSTGMTEQPDGTRTTVESAADGSRLEYEVGPDGKMEISHTDAQGNKTTY